MSQKIDIAREFYLGVSVDDYYGTPVAIVSVEGGVSVNRLVQGTSGIGGFQTVVYYRRS